MKKIAFLLTLLCLQQIAISQAFFPTDQASGKVYYHKTEELSVPKTEKYNRTRTWFMNYYKTSKFEDHFKITKKGKPIQLEEDKTNQTITGKCGFYIMYPIDRSGLVMEQTFVMFTMTIRLTDSSYENLITDLICYSGKTSSGGDMRPPEYGLEAYNERRLNDKDYVQQYVIPQVTNAVRKVQEELSRNIRYGNLTETKQEKYR